MLEHQRYPEAVQLKIPKDAPDTASIPQPHYPDRSRPDNGGESPLRGTRNHIVRYTAEPGRDLTKVEERVRTYLNWPNTQMGAVRMADAGFYYTGVSDVVRCPYCGAEGYKWVRGDDPLEDHRRWTPNCRFLLERDETGAAAGPAAPEQDSAGRDTCGLYDIQIFPNSVTEDEVSQQLDRVMVKTTPSLHPEYRLIESRVKSFENWPKSLVQKPAELAEAGFFYLGIGDQVLCFQCGGGLKDWDNEDLPWEQHATWFPECSYLRSKKDQEFIDEMQRLKRDNEEKVSESVQEHLEVEAADRSSTSRLAGASSSSATSQEEEKQEEDDNKLCKICFKNEMATLFLPCRHIVACADCSVALTKCAICRKGVEATIRVFLS